MTKKSTTNEATQTKRQRDARAKYQKKAAFEREMKAKYAAMLRAAGYHIDDQPNASRNEKDIFEFNLRRYAQNKIVREEEDARFAAFIPDAYKQPETIAAPNNSAIDSAIDSASDSAIESDKERNDREYREAVQARQKLRAPEPVRTYDSQIAERAFTNIIPGRVSAIKERGEFQNMSFPAKPLGEGKGISSGISQSKPSGMIEDKTHEILDFVIPGQGKGISSGLSPSNSHKMIEDKTHEIPFPHSTTLHSPGMTKSGESLNARQGKAEPAIFQETRFNKEENCENIRKERDRYKQDSEDFLEIIANLKKALLKEKEISLNLQLENDDWRAKFETMQFAEQKIQEHFKYLERNMFNYEYITQAGKEFVKLEKQKITKLKSSKKRIAKERAQTNFLEVDSELDRLKNLLKASGSEECLDLHREVVFGMENVQKSLLGLKFEVIEVATKNAEQDTKIQELNVKTKQLRALAGERKDLLVISNNNNRKIKILKDIYSAEIKEVTDRLHKQGPESESFDYLRKMPDVFKRGIEAFNEKLEVLLQNLHFTTAHDLFRGWLAGLRDFVGKSVGEVAAIEAWLSSPVSLQVAIMQKQPDFLAKVEGAMWAHDQEQADYGDGDYD